VTEDASASYRGYRKQALYTLWRICTDVDPSYTYRPESGEDVAVYDSSQTLVEVVQVKAYSEPLGLSAFSPTSPRGFFARMSGRGKETPACRNAIASYSPLGPQLQGAIEGDALHRRAVVRKLIDGNSQVTESEATRLLDALRSNVHRLDEGSMRSAIVDRLRSTVAGGDVESAIDLMLFWMFDAAENKRDITREHLEHQIERIGAHLAQLRDGSTEWMTSVCPVRDEEISEAEQFRLRVEYRKGAHASWKHVLADADCPRERLLKEIHEKFQKNAVVVVRGASGQGKTSLAWRYLRDYAADGLRFSVRVVEGRAHALRIANLLRGHAKTLRLSPIVYVDVSPADTGWAELLQPLAEASIKVLVTVREEDLARIGGAADVGAVSELALDRLSRDDAEQIYESLMLNVERSHFLDFDDIWAQFGAPDGGPLLEFAHLVSEGEGLKAKIEKQVFRLQADAGKQEFLSPSHLSLLALCAIANAADCRVDVQRLCVDLGLDPLVRPFALLENEYLLRVSDSAAGSHVSSVHPLRSKAVLAALLHDRPEAWIDYAVRVLPLLVDPDLETFLLTSFSRNPEHSARLQSALSAMPLASWTQASAITRALLWEGINCFEKDDREVLASAIVQRGSTWWWGADLLIGSSAGNELLPSLPETLRSKIQPLVLPSATHRFAPFHRWVARVGTPRAMPQQSSDWLGAGDVAFWIGTTNAETALRPDLMALLHCAIPEDLGLMELCGFVSGQSVLKNDDFPGWHRQHELDFARRYVSETESLHLDDDGHTVKVWFSVELEDGNPDAQAMVRLTALGQIFPHRERFVSEGIGLEVLGDLLPDNATIKDISRKDLVDPRAIHFNATTRALVSYRHCRGRRWSDYCQCVTAFRESACTGLERLHANWENMLAEPKVKQSTIDQFPAALLAVVQKSSELPMLPQVAVDEWGFASEHRVQAGISRASKAGVWDRLQKVKPWTRALRKYSSSVATVAQRAESATLLFLRERNQIAGPRDSKDSQLVINNLDAACKEVERCQSEYRNLFSHTGSAMTDALDRRETEILRKLWLVAFALVNEPGRRRKDATRYLGNEADQRRRGFLDALQKETTAAMASDGECKVLAESTDSVQSRLWIVADHRTARSIDDVNRKELICATWRAAHASRWRPQEWAPLSREWPELILVQLVRGKAIGAAGTRLSTSVLFSSIGEFEVKPHHLWREPIPDSEFLSAGIQFWDTPMLRAAFTWEAALIKFVLAGERARGIVQLVEAKGVPEEWLAHVELSLKAALTKTYDSLRNSHENLWSLLRTLALSESSDRELGNAWQSMIGAWPTTSTNEGGASRAPLPAYVSRFRDEPSARSEFVTEIVDWAIAVHARLR